MADPEPAIIAALAVDAPTTKQTVDPWNVAGEIGADGIAKAINYLSLIEEFGTKRILQEDLARFEKVTGYKPHRFMRRGIVFSHRDLNLILDRHEKGETFFLYTGRGPSSDSMHIGKFCLYNNLDPMKTLPTCGLLRDIPCSLAPTLMIALDYTDNLAGHTIPFEFTK
jgi:tryptophanyl-tRNA synthetase